MSQYAWITLEYAWLWLNMPEYAWLCQNMRDLRFPFNTQRFYFHSYWFFTRNSIFKRNQVLNAIKTHNIRLQRQSVIVKIFFEVWIYIPYINPENDLLGKQNYTTCTKIYINSITINVNFLKKIIKINIKFAVFSKAFILVV